MIAAIRRVFPVAIAIILVLAITACGSSSKQTRSSSTAVASIPPSGPLPPGVVAAVRSTPITSADLQHWLGVAYNEISLQATHQPLPSPPAYASCVATLHHETGPISTEPITTLRSQCAQHYSLARSDAIGFLIRAQWLLQEADSQHVGVSSSALNHSVSQEIKMQHPGPGTFEKFLAKTGMTAADFDLKVHLNVLAELLQRKGEPAVTVSSAQVAHYYRAHLSEYALPARRKTLAVETQGRATALKAKALLVDGQPWAAVAKRYSIDFSKFIGGVFTVTPKEQNPTLVHAVFSAPRGPILGPVAVPAADGGKTYYVFKVTGSIPASEQPFSAVAAQIKQLLNTDLQQKSLASFGSAYLKRWKALTRCRAGYVISECSNGPRSSNGA